MTQGLKVSHVPNGKSSFVNGISEYYTSGAGWNKSSILIFKILLGFISFCDTLTARSLHFCLSSLYTVRMAVTADKGIYHILYINSCITFCKQYCFFLWKIIIGNQYHRCLIQKWMQLAGWCLCPIYRHLRLLL